MKTTTKGADRMDEVEETEIEAREVAFSPFAEFLTRLGFGARGLIYLVMGVISVQVVRGTRITPADQEGALAAMGAQPFGRFLLLLVMVGLVGYTLWGLIGAIFDPLHLGSDAGGLLRRLAIFVSAGMYASLIVPAFDYFIGGVRAANSGAQPVQTQQYVSTILAKPGGRWVVGSIGIVVIGIGLAQVYVGVRRKFDLQFRLYDLDHPQSVWIKRLGRFGTVMRGIVISLIGVFLVLAAYQFNSKQARGFDGVLTALARRPYGPWSLGIVAVGLIAFGIYSIVGLASIQLDR